MSLSILSLYYDDEVWQSDRPPSFKEETRSQELVAKETKGQSTWSTFKSWCQDNPKRSSSLLCFLVLTPVVIAILDFVVSHKAEPTSHFHLIAPSNNSTISSASSTPFAFTSTHGRGSHSAISSSVAASASTASVPAKPSPKPSPSRSPLAVVPPTVPPLSFNLDSSQCFPLGSAQLKANGTLTLPRLTWWCDPSLLYGFMGFSYPLEASDCDDPTNSFASINADFAKMKRHGSSIVRIYAPECRELSVWENIVKAAIQNNLAVIPMVWWGFESQSLWETSQSNLYSLFTTSTYATVAPFVVHSVAFGSEPIGDQVDGGPYGGFITDLAKFRRKMNSFGIPVAVSEDWDRKQPGYEMNSTSGVGVGAVGAMIKANTDLVHAHVMPYYHPDETPLVTDALPYLAVYLQWLKVNVRQPIMVTETMWSSTAKGGHGRGARMDQVGPSEFNTYWKIFASNCALFKKYKAGWFFHTFQDTFEPGFGLLDQDGDAKIPNYAPARC